MIDHIDPWLGIPIGLALVLLVVVVELVAARSQR